MAPPVRYRAGEAGEADSDGGGEEGVRPLRWTREDGLGASTVDAARDEAAAEAAELIRREAASAGFWTQHKVARGRGRKKQLDGMSASEKATERRARMERMRLAARECRLRKKLNTERLEELNEELAGRVAANDELIEVLRVELAELQRQSPPAAFAVCDDEQFALDLMLAG